MSSAKLAALYKELEIYSEDHIIKWTDEEYRLLNNQYRNYNRFSFRIPYERNRVKLKYKGPSHEMTYINASHVQHRERKYLASQAPLPHTTEDFWNMIVEQDVFVIVTLVRLKGEHYWPMHDSSHAFPSISITNLFEREISSSQVIIRRFRLKLKNGSYREIHQLHYLGWPDHGVPTSHDSVNQLLQMTQSLSIFHKETPILVHCRAGIGRTGTFCVLDSILNGRSLDTQSEDQEDLVIPAIKNCRSQRNGMVETFVTNSI